MAIQNDSDRRSSCDRCGGCYVPDQDGDLFCLMCGRPAHWQGRMTTPAVQARREQAA